MSAFAAESGDHHFIDKTIGTEGGNKRPANSSTRPPVADRGHLHVAGEAQGGALLGEDNPHVPVPRN